jgi:phosphoesterase RecJ-like protein
MGIQKVIDKLKNNKSFLITAHMNLEGDALGSELAMYLILKRLGKKNVVICNNDPTPEIYGFLPSIKVIKHSIKNEKFDVALFLDCSDSSRAGWVKDAMAKAKSIINIDHHISNTYFGDVNWVDPKASSACQMIYKLCEKLGIMDKKIATCLYTGIFTDTGSFTYANTTPTTHKIIAKLIKYGVNPHHIDEELHSLCSTEDLDFISKVASNLKYDARRKICWAQIKKWHDRGYDLTEIIFSVMRLLKDIEVFVLFKQLGRNKIRVNFRSRNYVDVNKIAQFFGGGGHKRASGTTIEDTMERTCRKVIAFIKRYTNGKPRLKR